jgi:hypothetical protein
VINFRKTINLRIALVTLFNSIFGLIGLFSRYLDFDIAVNELVWSLSLGLMCGTILIGVYILAIYIRALRNDDLLQKLFISETDERNILIRSKTGGMAINIIMAALVLATIVSGVFSEIVYFTLLMTLLFVAIIKGALKLYYRSKI